MHWEFINYQTEFIHYISQRIKTNLYIHEFSLYNELYLFSEYKINNLTTFRKEVIDIINTIEFGNILTYKDIAEKKSTNRKLKRMSAQAVGGAVGWNPICIIIPCHRVVGSNGNLTGYGGGIKNKIALLTLEKNDMSKYFIPKKGTAL